MPKWTDAGREWLESRPEVVRDVALRYPPWNHYQLKTTGQNAVILAYGENGTVRCRCWHDFAPELTMVEVFGIDPEDLSPPNKENQ